MSRAARSVDLPPLNFDYKPSKLTMVHNGHTVVVNYDAGGYGHYVVIRHYNGLETLYGHLSLPLVHTDCSFVRSPTFGERCVVESCVERLGGKSFTVRHRFLDADGVHELASGRETRCSERSASE